MKLIDYYININDHEKVYINYDAKDISYPLTMKDRKALKYILMIDNLWDHRIGQAGKHQMESYL